MCLFRITDEIREDPGYGWKVCGRGWKGRLRSLHMRKPVPLDRWLEADPVLSALGHCTAHRARGSEDYRHGFHLFADFADAVYLAESYSRHLLGARIVVKRVRYRDLFCSGDGGGGRREIVAGEIFVPSETEWTVMPREDERRPAVSRDPLEEITRRLLREIQRLAPGNPEMSGEREAGWMRSIRRERR